MTNPFEKFTTRDWLYVGGAIASIIALIAFIYKTQGYAVNAGAGPITDQIVPGITTAPPGSSQTTGANGTTPAPNYITYNMGNPNATWPATYGGPPPVGADMAPNGEGRSCCCPQTNDCAGNSPLATGNTFSSLDDLLDFYKQTNPYYIQGQEAQMQVYAADFATGETYSTGAVSLNASSLAPLGPIQ